MAKKIERNKERDKLAKEALMQMGWAVMTIWECQLKPKVRIQTLESLAYTLNHIFLEDRKIRTYDLPDINNTPMVAEPEVTYGRKEQ